MGDFVLILTNVLMGATFATKKACVRIQKALTNVHVKMILLEMDLNVQDLIVVRKIRKIVMTIQVVYQLEIRLNALAILGIWEMD